MIYRNQNSYHSMSLIHTTFQGTELWLGDYYAATDLNLLKSKKITSGTCISINSVLTAAAMLNINYPREAGINHKVINAIDIPTYRMAPHFQEAFQFIKEGLQKGNVLVHCAAGVSRSATFVLVYMMRQIGISLDEGLQYVKSKRPVVNPNQGFMNELIGYNHFLWDASVKHSLRKSQVISNYYPENPSYYPRHQKQKSFFNLLSQMFDDKPRNKQFWEWF